MRTFKLSENNSTIIREEHRLRDFAEETIWPEEG
jgi:hypothetical protein